MKGNYDNVLDTIVAPWEHGNVDDPIDPGGRTKDGVTQSVYNAWRTKEGQPHQDVYLMADSERRSIFKTGYWDAAHCDEWRIGADASIMDWSVNSGVSRGIKKLQTLLAETSGYTGKVDGWVGVKTIAAATEACSTLDGTVNLIRRYNEMRTTFVKSLSTFWHFGKGWINRITDVTAKSVAMAVRGFGVDPAPRLEQEAARADQRASENSATMAGAGMVGGSTGGGGLAYGTPDAAASGHTTIMIIALVILIATAAVVVIMRGRHKVNTAFAESFKREAAAERAKV